MKRFMVGMLTVMVLMSVITPFAFAVTGQWSTNTDFVSTHDTIEDWLASLGLSAGHLTYDTLVQWRDDGRVICISDDGTNYEIDIHTGYLPIYSTSKYYANEFADWEDEKKYYDDAVYNASWDIDVTGASVGSATISKADNVLNITRNVGTPWYPTSQGTSSVYTYKFDEAQAVFTTHTIYDKSDLTHAWIEPLVDNDPYPEQHPSTEIYMNVWIADSATWVDNEIANSETSGYKTIWDFKVPLYDSRNDMYYYQHFFVASNGDKYTQPFTVVMNETYGYISIIAMTDFKMQTLAERYSADLIVAKDTVMNIDIADSHSGIAYTSDEDTHATYGYQKFSISDVMYDDGGSVLDQFETAELYFLNEDMQSFDDADLNDTNTASGQMVLNVMMHYTAYDTDLILAYIDPDDMYPAIQMTYTGNVTEVSSQKVDEWSREVDGVTNYYFTKRVTLQFTSGDAFVGARLSYIRDDGTYTDLEDSATFSYSGNGSGGYYVTTPDVDDHIDDVMSLGDILLKPFQTFYNIASSMVQYIAMPLFNIIPNFIPYEVRSLMLLSITFGLLAFITGRG